MATRTWIGGQADIPDVWTITIAGTWASGDTITISGGAAGDDLILTLGTTSAGSTATVAEAIYDAINATTRSDDVNSDESRNIGGQQIPSIAELAATVSGSVVTVEADTPGVYHELTVNKSSTSGTATLSQSQSSTGKNYWNDADNWSGGAVPTTDDTVIVKDSAVDILYGLPSTNFHPAQLDIRGSYTGKIGLPSTNTGGYPEWRNRWLTIDENGGGTDPVIVNIGEGSGNGSSRLNIKNTAIDTTYTVHATTGLNIYSDGTGFSMTVHDGTVACTGATAASSDLSSLTMYGGTVTLDDMVTASSSTIQVEAGTLNWEALGSGAGTFRINGGTVNLTARPPATIEINGGTVNYIGGFTGGDLTLLSVSGEGVFDCSSSPNPISVTDIKIYEGTGTAINDPDRRINYTNDPQLIRCGLDRINFGENVDIDIDSL